MSTLSSKFPTVSNSNSLNDYQKLFRDWGIKKNRTQEEWRILKRKLEARGAIHKKSVVYFKMKPLPDDKVKKELGRKSLHMTAIESFKFNQGTIIPEGT